MIFIDTHAHLDDGLYEGELGEIIDRAFQADVEYIIVPGTDLKSSVKAAEISGKFSGVFFAAGIHCHEAGKFNDNDLFEIKKILRRKECVAIGEVGLDYHYDFSPRDAQKQVLARFIDLALEVNMPLILHCRKAEEDLISMLKPHRGKLRGVIHCYTGGLEDALKFACMGFYIGFTGIITFKKSEELQQVVRQIPIDRILTETDSPYMTPVPHRGKRNEPAYVSFVAEKIAEIHGKSIEEMFDVFVENASRLFFEGKIIL